MRYAKAVLFYIALISSVNCLSMNKYKKINTNLMKEIIRYIEIIEADNRFLQNYVKHTDTNYHSLLRLLDSVENRRNRQNRESNYYRER